MKIFSWTLAIAAAVALQACTPSIPSTSTGPTKSRADESMLLTNKICKTVRERLAVDASILTAGKGKTQPCDATNKTSCAVSLFVGMNQQTKRCYIKTRFEKIQVERFAQVTPGQNRSRNERIIWSFEADPAPVAAMGEVSVDPRDYEFHRDFGITLDKNDDTQDLKSPMRTGPDRFQWSNLHLREKQDIEWCPHVFPKNGGDECEAIDPLILNQ